jgi:uncharacterized protein (UPF0335 family)
MSEPQAGHNGQLKAIVERVVNLEDQKKELGKDIAEIYLEAKGNGFNLSAIRVIVRKQRQDAKKAAELQADVDAYLAALGLLA